MLVHARCLLILELLLSIAVESSSAGTSFKKTTLPQQYAVNESHSPCYICAAAWKFRERSSAIDDQHRAQLINDDDKCCASSVVRDVEKTLETIDPVRWQNTAVDGGQLKRDTDKILYSGTANMHRPELRRLLDTLQSKWHKYWDQQAFNKRTALSHWLRIPGIRKRLAVIEKDIRGETSRRSRRLQQRVQDALRSMDKTKTKLRDLYAVYHKEGKSRFSHSKLSRRLNIALQHNNQLRTSTTTQHRAMARKPLSNTEFSRTRLQQPSERVPNTPPSLAHRTRIPASHTPSPRAQPPPSRALPPSRSAPQTSRGSGGSTARRQHH